MSSKPTLASTHVATSQATTQLSSSNVDAVSQYTLQWRQHQLWVTPSTSMQSLALPSLNNPAMMTDCLRQSAVKLVVLDPALGTEVVQIWLQVCAAATKRAVVRGPVVRKKLNKGDRLLPWLKQLPERSVSALMLAIFSPFILGIHLFLQIATLLASPRWQRALSGLR
jgi:hypothetical protein